MIINCPRCGEALELPEEAVGAKVQCPFCEETFVGAAKPSASTQTPAQKPSCPSKATKMTPPDKNGGWLSRVRAWLNQGEQVKPNNQEQQQDMDAIQKGLQMAALRADYESAMAALRTLAEDDPKVKETIALAERVWEDSKDSRDPDSDRKQLIKDINDYVAKRAQARGGESEEAGLHPMYASLKMKDKLQRLRDAIKDFPDPETLQAQIEMADRLLRNASTDVKFNSALNNYERVKTKVTQAALTEKGRREREEAVQKAKREEEVAQQRVSKAFCGEPTEIDIAKGEISETENEYAKAMNAVIDRQMKAKISCVDAQSELDRIESEYDGKDGFVTLSKLKQPDNNSGFDKYHLDSLLATPTRADVEALRAESGIRNPAFFKEAYKDPAALAKTMEARIPLIIGKGNDGEWIVEDLAGGLGAGQHALVCGNLGTGKTMWAKAEIMALLMKDPKFVTPFIIDPRGLKFFALLKQDESGEWASNVKGLAFAGKQAVLPALKVLRTEIERRKQLLARAGCTHIALFNCKYQAKPLPYVPVIVADDMWYTLTKNHEALGIVRDIMGLRPDAVGMHFIAIDNDATEMPADLSACWGYRMSFRQHEPSIAKSIFDNNREAVETTLALRGPGAGVLVNLSRNTMYVFQAPYVREDSLGFKDEFNKIARVRRGLWGDGGSAMSAADCDDWIGQMMSTRPTIAGRGGTEVEATASKPSGNGRSGQVSPSQSAEAAVDMAGVPDGLVKDIQTAQREVDGIDREKDRPKWVAARMKLANLRTMAKGLAKAYADVEAAKRKANDDFAKYQKSDSDIDLKSWSKSEIALEIAEKAYNSLKSQYEKSRQSLPGVARQVTQSGTAGQVPSGGIENKIVVNAMANRTVTCPRTGRDVDNIKCLDCVRQSDNWKSCAMYAESVEYVRKYADKNNIDTVPFVDRAACEKAKKEAEQREMNKKGCGCLAAIFGIVIAIGGGTALGEGTNAGAACFGIGMLITIVGMCVWNLPLVKALGAISVAWTASGTAVKAARNLAEMDKE